MSLWRQIHNDNLSNGRQEGKLAQEHHVPVQVEGGNLCIVSLEINEVEKVFWSFLMPLLPDNTHTQAHTHAELDHIFSFLFLFAFWAELN